MYSFGFMLGYIVCRLANHYSNDDDDDVVMPHAILCIAKLCRYEFTHLILVVICDLYS